MYYRYYFYFFCVGIITHFVLSREIILRKLIHISQSTNGQLIFESYSGSIFNKIFLMISLVKNDGQTIRFQKLIIDIGVFETIFSKPTVGNVNSSACRFKSKSKSEKNFFLDDLDYGSLNFFEIKQLLISGDLDFEINGKDLNSKVQLQGSINKNDSEQINIEKVKSLERAKQF